MELFELFKIIETKSNFTPTDQMNTNEKKLKNETLMYKV